MAFNKEPIGNFIGNLSLEKPAEESFFETIFNKAKEIAGLDADRFKPDERKIRSAVNSRDIKLNHLHAKVQRRNTAAAQ